MILAPLGIASVREQKGETVARADAVRFNQLCNFAERTVA
jgi:hypothetical protein